MAKKKAAIGDLIKSDMSRRSIGEEPAASKETGLFLDEEPVKKPSEKKPAAPSTAAPAAAAPPAPKAAPESAPAPKAPPTAAAHGTHAISEGGAAFMAFIAEQAKAAELTDKTDLVNFYDFLQSQAMRYIRGFNAGRRFHG